MFDYDIGDVIKGGNVTKVGCENFNSKVYFLLNDGVVVYVGKTLNLDSRMMSHNSSAKVFDNFSFICVPSDALSDCEAYYIVKFNPMYNKSIPSNNLYKSNKQAMDVIMDIIAREIEGIEPIIEMDVSSPKDKGAKRKFYSSDCIDEIAKSVINAFNGK